MSSLPSSSYTQGQKTIPRPEKYATGMFFTLVTHGPAFQVRATSKNANRKSGWRFLLLMHTLDITFPIPKVTIVYQNSGIFRSQVSTFLSAVQAIHNHADHHFLFFRFGFRNHDRQRHQRMIIDQLFPLIEQCAVLIQEVKERRCGDALIAVRFAAFSSSVGYISCPPKDW